MGRSTAMKRSPTDNVFGLLSESICDSLVDLGFKEPTLHQKMAIPSILAGDNILLVAPNGSGKTEAVLLPVFSKLLERNNRKRIAAVYITPLRALNRDMLRRLSFWASRLGITIEVRHGDTGLKLRRRQAKSPPDILITTPETLQAILPGSLMKKHLSHVQFVVVDEVHGLAPSKRGAQLMIALERLRETTGKEFQRIGLSATIGNPDEVAAFLVGTGRSFRIIDASLPKGYDYHVEAPQSTQVDFDLAAKLNTSPSAAARISRMIELIDAHESTLIFVNSRTVAEMLGNKINQLGRMDIAVHHGSLSKEERGHIEDDFKSGTLKAIICTSTLELGIDIGTVDLVIQYLSPRQVSSLIQRVGRSGHRLDKISRGIIITAAPDDTLESIAATKNANLNRLEPIIIHENALDVLAHQTAGVLMDQSSINVGDALSLFRKSYPYRNLAESTFLDVVNFLRRLGELRIESEGKVLRKGPKTRRYYFENLSMIPDEKRYPIVNVISDRRIGTLGDEFMALKARVGLNFIIKGKVWRIVNIETETGTVYVVPSEDPLAAIPGWDGEMLPITFDLAQETGRLREEILNTLKETKDVDITVEQLSQKLSVEKFTLRSSVQEVEQHVKQGAPLPTDKRIVIERYDRFLVIHACFGESVNRTFGCIFDAVLSDREIITGWWTDGYRILVETPRKLRRRQVEELRTALFDLTDEGVETAFQNYLDMKFPFSNRMKFIAARFGALQRGKTMSYENLSQLPTWFGNTPIYDETLREAKTEKVDLKRAKEILGLVESGKMEVRTVTSLEEPTPLAFHILSKFSETAELMAPKQVLLSNLDQMRMTIEAKTTRLLCMSCGEWTGEDKIRHLDEHPECGVCESRLLAPVRFNQDMDHLRAVLKKRVEDRELTDDELKELTNARRTADLVLSYGKKAIVALEVRGIGPETAFRILGKMHIKENEFYMDLLKAKIHYLRTREFWKD